MIMTIPKLILAAAIASGLPAQDASELTSQGPFQDLTALQRVVLQSPNKFDLSFSGGTLEQFAAALRKSCDGVSIVLAESVRSNRVPSLELRACQIEPALQAVARIVQPKIEITTTGPTTFAISEDAAKPARQESRVAVLKIHDLSRGALGMETVPADVLERWSANLMAALTAGLELIAENDGSKPTLKYHKETGLLFVRATDPQHDLIMEIASKVGADVPPEDKHKLTK